jgi:hypothetical protein
VGRAVFAEVFPLVNLPMRIPKSMFYHLLLMYTVGSNTAEGEVSRQRILFQDMVYKIIKRLKASKEGMRAANPHYVKRDYGPRQRDHIHIICILHAQQSLLVTAIL